MDTILDSLTNRCVGTGTHIGFVRSANPAVIWKDGNTCGTEVVVCGSGTKDRVTLMAKNMKEISVLPFVYFFNERDQYNRLKSMEYQYILIAGCLYEKS